MIKGKKRSKREKEEKEEKEEVGSFRWEKGQGPDTRLKQNKFISVLCLLSLGVGRYVAREVLKTKCSERSETDKKE